MNPAPMPAKADVVKKDDVWASTTSSGAGIGGSVDGRASRPMPDAVMATDTMDAESMDAVRPGSRSTLKQGCTAGVSYPVTYPVPARHAHATAPGTVSTHSAWRGQSGQTLQVRGDVPAAHWVQAEASSPVTAWVYWASHTHTARDVDGDQVHVPWEPQMGQAAQVSTPPDPGEAAVTVTNAPPAVSHVLQLGPVRPVAHTHEATPDVGDHVQTPASSPAHGGEQGVQAGPT